MPLENTTCKFNPKLTFSIGAVQTNKVLCGVSKNSTLEVLAIDATGTARCLQPIRLDFEHFCFTTGRWQDIELIIIKHAQWPKVRLLEVVDGESLGVQELCVIEINTSRLLWSAGLLFTTSKNIETDTHEVSLFQVSNGGRCYKSFGTFIAHSKNLKINCWSAVGEKIAICDKKSKTIFIFEFKNFFKSFIAK